MYTVNWIDQPTLNISSDSQKRFAKLIIMGKKYSTAMFDCVV